MIRVRFVEPARLELLAEVAYHHRLESGLGTKFLEAVEDASALAYPLAGSSAQNRTRRVFLKDFHSHCSIALTSRESQSMHWLIMHANQVIGRAAQMPANVKTQKMEAIAICFVVFPARF